MECTPIVAVVLLLCLILIVCAFSLGLRTCHVYILHKFCGAREKYCSLFAGRNYKQELCKLQSVTYAL